MAPYTSEILDTIRNIPPEEWDATIGIAGGVRHAMLTCYESGHPNAKDLRYILLRDDERLHAVCVAMSFDINNKTRLAQRILGPLADRWQFIRNCSGTRDDCKRNGSRLWAGLPDLCCGRVSRVFVVGGSPVSLLWAGLPCFCCGRVSRPAHFVSLLWAGLPTRSFARPARAAPGGCPEFG